MENAKHNPHYSITNSEKVEVSDEEWKKILSPDVYKIARQKGTERPGTSEFEHSKEVGTYYCGACGNALFKSDTKFESGCGWPSFYEGIDKSKIKETRDISHGMTRIEVTCNKCGGHLGHVFDDGPKDKTGLRYCINSVSLGFVPIEKYDSLQKK